MDYEIIFSGICIMNTFLKLSFVLQPFPYVPTITNYTQLWWLPNVVVAHQKEGIEAVHLATGRTLCKVNENPKTLGSRHMRPSMCNYTLYNSYNMPYFNRKMIKSMSVCFSVSLSYCHVKTIASFINSLLP